MPIQFACSCGRKLQAQEEHIGRRVQCPACGAETTVPGPEDAVQTEEPPRPKTSPVTPAESRRSAEDDRDEDRPRRSRRREDDEDDDARGRRSRDDDRDDRRRSRYDDDDDDERREPAGTSGKAVAALVLGLLSLCVLGILAGLPAIILGFMGLRDIDRGRGRLGGKGMAITGLVLGFISVLTSLLLLLLVPAVWKVRESANRIQSHNNLRQISLAMMNDADFNQGRMVAPAICDKNGKPLLSWRVAILPYIEQQGLYNQFHLDEPWDSPHNMRLVAQMPKVYAHPAADPAATARGETHYRVFTGPQTPFPAAEPPFETHRSSMRYPFGFTDGVSNTILVVEAADAVPWTKPDELPYNPNGPLPRLGLQPGKGFSAVMADGGVRQVSGNLSDATLRAAITPNGNDLLGPDW
jgi:hypothetical protein